jgi:hypothetical protein
MVGAHNYEHTSVDIYPRFQPNQALSALSYGLKPNFNLFQSRHGHMSIACAHVTVYSNAPLIQVSHVNLLRDKYTQSCNQGNDSYT